MVSKSIDKSGFEGTGYRAKTRFAKFYNLPELINMFREIADVQTGDMLKLPVPDVQYHNEVIKPSEFQKDMVKSFADRAERVRNGMVDSSVDNMLKITNDGRKLALDQRLQDSMLPDDPSSKVNACVENIYRIWDESKEQRSTQLVFCDLSTPHDDGKFNVYDDVKQKLIERGVPESEIAYIHDANTETRKAELFGNVRTGKVRILLGSTAKMGAGTNVQKLLIAEHHLDIPWRPSDIEQREGRILRQGNIQRMDNALNSLPHRKEREEAQLAELKKQMDNAKEEIDRPFPQEEELATKSARLSWLRSCKSSLDQQ